MAGSFASIVDDRGRFRMDLIENLGDAEEALRECFHIIRALAESAAGPGGVEGDMFPISNVCQRLRFTAINVDLKADYLFDRLGDIMDEEPDDG
ncbi:hypothetical protein LCGC14_0163980 [marine sediment metagenome]|uniref:Uncharacterized protein n=1 Tax=marine sediment metagenome TaxID=412755 RepID=A0A0F9UYF7_9ZZZZ